MGFRDFWGLVGGDSQFSFSTHTRRCRARLRYSVAFEPARVVVMHTNRASPILRGSCPSVDGAAIERGKCLCCRNLDGVTVTVTWGGATRTLLEGGHALGLAGRAGELQCWSRPGTPLSHRLTPLPRNPQGKDGKRGTRLGPKQRGPPTRSVATRYCTALAR